MYNLTVITTTILGILVVIAIELLGRPKRRAYEQSLHSQLAALLAGRDDDFRITFYRTFEQLRVGRAAGTFAAAVALSLILVGSLLIAAPMPRKGVVSDTVGDGLTDGFSFASRGLMMADRHLRTPASSEEINGYVVALAEEVHLEFRTDKREPEGQVKMVVTVDGELSKGHPAVTEALRFPYSFGARVTDTRTDFAARACQPDKSPDKSCLPIEIEYDEPRARVHPASLDASDVFYSFATIVRVPPASIHDGKFRLRFTWVYRGWKVWPTVNWIQVAKYPNLRRYDSELHFSVPPIRHMALAYDRTVGRFAERLPDAIMVELPQTSKEAKGRDRVIAVSYDTSRETLDGGVTATPRYSPVLLFLPDTREGIVRTRFTRELTQNMPIM